MKVPCSAMADAHPRHNTKVRVQGTEDAHTSPLPLSLEFACWKHWSKSSANLQAGVLVIIMQRTHARSARFRGKE